MRVAADAQNDVVLCRSTAANLAIDRKRKIGDPEQRSGSQR
jgi:hypothetical protein